MNPRGEAFGETQFGEFIATYEDLPAEQFAERLLDKVLGWPEDGSARAQADDITVVVIDIGNMLEHTH